MKKKRKKNSRISFEIFYKHVERMKFKLKRRVVISRNVSFFLQQDKNHLSATLEGGG